MPDKTPIPPPPSGQSFGPSIDRTGAPVIDPTENVKALSEAAAKRQDDLREKDKEISDIKHAHAVELAKIHDSHQTLVGKLREEYQEKIAKNESGRIDSIRQVDREEVAKTAVAANQAITVLAKQTTDLATTLDKKVTDTATAAEQRNSAVNTDFNKRIAALELSSSEGKGKQQVADPQTERMSMLVERLVTSQAEGTGDRRGKDDSWKFFIAIVGLIVSFLMIGSVVVGLVLFLNRSQQTPYTPAPQGTMLPVSPPAAVPR